MHKDLIKVLVTKELKVLHLEELKEHKDQQVLLDPQVLKGWLGLQDQLDHKELKGFKGLRDQLAHKEHKGLKVLQVHLQIEDSNQI